MMNDNEIESLDRQRLRPSRDRIAQTLQATRFSLERLENLLRAWKRGTSIGTYAEARDEILAELTTSQAYFSDLVALASENATSGLAINEWEIEIRRLSEELRRVEGTVRSLGITRPFA